MPKVSIISTCYNEELNIVECYETVKKQFQNLDIEYEHIFSDNNSNDKSADIIRVICKNDKNIKLLINAKNYGPFLNNYNALFYATGDFIIVNYACDMQDPPELLTEMVNEIKKGYDCIYAVKKSTDENFIIKSLRFIYYFIVDKLSENEIIKNTNEFICINKSVLESIKANEDYFPYIRGYIPRITDNYKIIYFNRLKRKFGKSKNSVFDLFKQAINGIISTMDNIIYLATIIFFITSICLLLFSLYSFGVKIFFPDLAPKGITTVLLILGIGFSMTMFVLSIILQYLLSIHNQVRLKFKVRLKEKVNF